MFEVDGVLYVWWIDDSATTPRTRLTYWFIRPV